MWFLPTHKRPERLQQTLDACEATGMSQVGLVIVNGPDQNEMYKSIRLPQNWQMIFRTEDEPLATFFNLLPKEYPEEEWYGMISDDVLPRTKGWDVELVKTAMEFGIASGNDLMNAPVKMTGAAVWKGQIVRDLGYMAPPGVRHMYIDDMWETIGRELGIWKCRMDVVTEHMHHLNGKAKMDDSYAESHNKHLPHDQPHYLRWANMRNHEYPKIEKFARNPTKTVDLKGLKVAIGTPCYDGKVDLRYHNSFLATAIAFMEHGIQFQILPIPNESLVMRARNQIVKRFIESGCDYLLWIDSDMGWRAESAIRLLAFGYDLSGVAGPRKADELSFCTNLIGPPILMDQKTGFLKAQEIGCGFTLVSRKCIDKMMKKYAKKLTYHDLGMDEDFVALYDTSLKDGKFWSEDYTFCHRWTAIGGEVWVDPSQPLAHVGPKAWSGCFGEWLNKKDREARKELEQLKEAAD